MQPKFRMFAGPNASGKTSLFDFLKTQSFIHTEIYINADSIEEKISFSMNFNFNAFHVKVSDNDFKKHILQSGILKKISDKTFIDKLQIKSGILKMNIKKKELNSYMASFIASYLAEKLFETKQSFCFETVLSHPSKINLLKLAQRHGYKTYLYFVFTDNWQLNIERVKLRVAYGGHNVDDKKVRTRYYRSLKLFKPAALLANDSFLIDNSRNFELIAELKNGNLLRIADKYPEWLKKYYEPKSKVKD